MSSTSVVSILKNKQPSILKKKAAVEEFTLFPSALAGSIEEDILQIATWHFQFPHPPHAAA